MCRFFLNDRQSPAREMRKKQEDNGNGRVYMKSLYTSQLMFISSKYFYYATENLDRSVSDLIILYDAIVFER